jgi:hypothetical protein
MIDTPRSRDILFGWMHLDGKIGAPKLTHPASDAVIRPRWKDLAVLKLQHLLWTERNADTAALAIILADNMKESFF